MIILWLVCSVVNSITLGVHLARGNYTVAVMLAIGVVFQCLLVLRHAKEDASCALKS